jgi:hypothetical protein
MRNIYRIENCKIHFRRFFQLGLMDMGDDSDGGDAGDAELEDELNKIMFGGSKTTKPKKKGQLYT